MTLVLPRLTDMVRADEYTLTPEQELRLLDDRKRRTRWWFAPHDTAAPGPRHDPETTRLVEPWLNPWVQLNDPAVDTMVGVCVLNETDTGSGLLIWVNPTEEARIAWGIAWKLGEAYGQGPGTAPASLGCETGIRVDPDYRAVFRHALPLPALSAGTVRWSFSRDPQTGRSHDVMTGGWLPAQEGL